MVRRLACAVAIVPLVLAVASCGSSSSSGGASSSGGKTLHIYAWADEIPQEMVSAFHKKTGINVTMDTYTSNEDMIAKLSAGATGYDLVEPSQEYVPQLARQGLIQPIDHSKLTGLDNVMQKFANPVYDRGLKYSVPLIYGTTGLAYNDKCTGGPVTTWAPLFDPKYKGKIYMLDNMLSSYIPALQVNGYPANSTDPAQIEKATQTLLKQKPLLAGYNSTNYAQLLASNQACVALSYNGGAIVKAMKSNPHVHYILPSEGGSVWVDSLSITKSAQNVSAAYAFINFVLDPKNAAIEANAGGSAPANSAALPFVKHKSYINNPAEIASSKQLRNADFILDPGKATKDFQKGWTEVRTK